MITTGSVVLLGFALGLRHALDADHVAAVGAIVSRAPTLRRAAVIGAWWGIGHSLTFLLAGGAIVLFRVALPPRASAVMELLVALTLIGVGLLNLRRMPPHDHALLRPVTVGIIHGLAASAAVALLIVPAIRDGFLAIIYLVIFGLGTVVGMVIMTCVVATPVFYLQSRFGAQRALTDCFGVVSICIGLFIGYRVVA